MLTAQNPASIIARIFNHLPLNIKASVQESSFVNKVKELMYECMFYEKFEYFEHKFA
jgi:hypothetical protein